jgi:hypothetical protein
LLRGSLQERFSMMVVFIGSFLIKILIGQMEKKIEELKQENVMIFTNLEKRNREELMVLKCF